MTTIAELGIKVDSTDAAQASSDLDKLTDAGKKSEETAKKTGKAWEQAMSGMAADTQQIVKELQALNAKQDATAQMMATLGHSISSASASFTSAAASMSGYRAESEKAGAAQKEVAETADQAKARMLAIAQAAVSATQAETVLTSTAKGLSEAQQGLVSTTSASASAHASASRAQRNAVSATDKLASSTAKATVTVSAQQAELQQLLEHIDPATRALNRLDEQEKKLAQHKKLGLDPATFSEYQAKIDQSRANLTRFDDGLTRTGNTAKQTAAALRGVPAQFTDIAVSLQGGQAPLTVLLQQGGQLKDMFGGIGPAAKALGGYVLGLVNPFTVAAAAVGVLTLAYYQGSNEADAYNKSLILTGNYAGVTAGNLSSMARQVSATVGTTGAAASVLAQLAGNGKIAAGSFEEITKAALTMQSATGKAVEETVAEFASIGKEPVAASLKLNEQYHYLTASVYEQIVALEKQGEQAAAVKLATDSFADAIQSRGDKITERLGLIEGAWNKVGKAAKWAWDAALDVGREATYEEKLADLEKQAQNAARLGAGSRGGGGRSLAAIEADRTSLMVAEQERRSRAEAGRLDQEQQERSISARQRLNTLIDKGKSLTLQTADAYKKIDKDAEDAARKGTAYSAQQIAAAKKVEFERINGKPKTSAGTVDLTGFNNAQNQLKAVSSYYQNIQKELDAAQKAGLVSAESYSSQRVALVEQERVEVAAAYEAEISALEAAKGKASTSGAQRIQLDQKIADARASMVKAEQDANTQLEVLATAETGRIEKQKLAISSYTDALNQQNAALQRAGQRAAAGVGQGDRQASLTGSLNGIEDRANQQRLDLARDKADKSRNMSAEEYQAKLDAINRSEKDLAETTLSNYEQMSAAQSDWRNGATSAFSNYLESARDVAGQTKSLFTNAFGGMEDAIVNFAMTGKLSFSDFAKSILADMARIATRQASSSALSALFGAGLSYFSGSGAASAGSTQAGYTGTDLSGFSPGSVQAKGGAWYGGVQMFADGGAFTNSIVSKPTAFGMSGGQTGVMGEAGPEAIMPLTRTSSGKLGVMAMGGAAGATQINVEVHIDGDGNASSSADAPGYDLFGKELATFVEQKYQQLRNKDMGQGGVINKAIKGR